MTPLERAARAIVENYPLDSGESPLTWQEVLPVARAVIEAIREPSEAVRKAMRQTIPVTGHDWEYNDPIISDGVVMDDEPGNCWRAMIDALLKEGQ